MLIGETNFESLNKRLNYYVQMQTSWDEYMQQCIESLEKLSDKGILNGLGELMDDEIKSFVRSKLRVETIELLRMYKAFPILA